MTATAATGSLENQDMDNNQNLVRMANQIATYFDSYPTEEAVAETASHIRRFWHPRMRNDLLAYAPSAGNGLHVIVAQAVQQLREAT